MVTVYVQNLEITCQVQVFIYIWCLLLLSLHNLGTFGKLKTQVGSSSIDNKFNFIKIILHLKYSFGRLTSLLNNE
jgi:hypothetical protein